MASKQIEPTLEACVQSLSEAQIAEKNGANRLELCSNLEMDGLTPSTKFVETVLTEIKIPVRIMIRPRAGNFVYNNSEFNAMLQQIRAFRKLNVNGFVFGVLTQQNDPDIPRTKKLIKACGNKSTVFHRAIDVCPNPLKALPKLIDIGINGILTSGGAKTAAEGIPMLQKMLAIAPKQIIVAGRVSQKNLSVLHKVLNACQYHGTKVV